MTTARQRLSHLPGVLTSGYLFFLAIELLATGMKTSFKEPLASFLAMNAGRFTELVSFVVGILGTALVQSSSSVTAMCVVLVQEGVMPLVIAAGIVHGANLGTSVTSSIVAFFAEIRPLTGNPIRDARVLLFEARGPGFRRAVGAAVVHDLFNIVMVTGILLCLELPFGVILSSSEWLAYQVAGALDGSDTVLTVLSIVSPATWTRPIAHGLLGIGLPGWLLALAGLPLLLLSLRSFSGAMRAMLMVGVDLDDLDQVGHTLLGRHPADTFLRGMVVTALVQSSSATTSMVVPLAAMGLFDVRKVFPFILGANIGTTATALLAAGGRVGQPGFHEGLTIALSHLLLNALAVVLAVGVPGLSSRILAAADWLAGRAMRAPATLLVYLATLTLVTPAIVYTTPQVVAAAFLAVVVVGLLVGPALASRGARVVMGSEGG